MLGMLIAYDAAGNVVGTLDYWIIYDENDEPLGTVDFIGTEASGGKFRHKVNPDGTVEGVWEVSGAVASAAWPEWIGPAAHDFKVEVDATGKIVALKHKNGGHRRVRADIDAAIRGRIQAKADEAKAKGNEMRAAAREAGLTKKDADLLLPDPTPEPADIRDLVGGPNKPLQLDSKGRTVAAPKQTYKVTGLKLVGRGG